jgi:hypothetical protein
VVEHATANHGVAYSKTFNVTESISAETLKLESSLKPPQAHRPDCMSYARNCVQQLCKAEKCLRQSALLRRSRSGVAGAALAAVDSDGIPLRPTWSVNDLLASYPQPTISSSTLQRMYELSALVPPTEGTSSHAAITREMEDLIKLVEAVKLVHVEDSGHGIPDGRIWAHGVGIPMDKTLESGVAEEESRGRVLLKHAQRTHNGFYVVEKNSRRE